MWNVRLESVRSLVELVIEGEFRTSFEEGERLMGCLLAMLLY